MAIKTRTVTVGDTPTLIASPSGGDAEVYQTLWDRVPTPPSVDWLEAVEVFLGGPDVTTVTGRPLAARDDVAGSMTFGYRPQEATDLLYGVAPTGKTAKVRVFEVGKV